MKIVKSISTRLESAERENIKSKAVLVYDQGGFFDHGEFQNLTDYIESLMAEAYELGRSATTL